MSGPWHSVALGPYRAEHATTMSYGSSSSESQPHTPYEPVERPAARPVTSAAVRRVALATAGAIAVATAVVAFGGKQTATTGGAVEPPAESHIFAKFERTPDSQEVLGPEVRTADAPPTATATATARFLPVHFNPPHFMPCPVGPPFAAPPSHSTHLDFSLILRAPWSTWPTT